MKNPIIKLVLGFGVVLSIAHVAIAAVTESPWRVGEDYYDDFSDAVAKGYETSKPLMLMRNLTLSSADQSLVATAQVGKESQELVLDLNGNTITSSVGSVDQENHILTVSASTKLRLVSSSDGGMIAQNVYVDDPGCTGILIADNGSLLLGRNSGDAGAYVSCAISFGGKDSDLSIINGRIDAEGNEEEDEFFWKDFIADGSILSASTVVFKDREYYEVTIEVPIPVQVPDADTPASVSNALDEAGVPIDDAIYAVVTNKAGITLLNELLTANGAATYNGLGEEQKTYLADSFVIKENSTLTNDDANHLFTNAAEIVVSDFSASGANWAMTVKVVDGAAALKIAAAKLAEKVQKCTELPNWSAVEAKDISVTSGDGTDTVVLTIAPPGTTNGFLRVNITK